MYNKLLFLIGVTLSLVGCSFADVFVKTQRTLLTTSFGNNEVMIYGGSNHDVYLGSLNLPENAPNSIWNNSGKYGNNDSEFSIKNKSGKYGSSSSPLSSCNKAATNPPKLKDKYDFDLGYFSLNPKINRRVGQAFLNVLEDICDGK